MPDKIDSETQVNLESAVFKKLVEHFRSRTDVQNIDLMNLAGFCRNCLANWYMDAANEVGIELSKLEAREIIYGMPFSEWKEKYQVDATELQQAQFAKNNPQH